MEISLGTTLKGLRIPLGGAMLTAASCLIFLTGRYFIKRKGSILMMGMVAGLIKIFSVGTVIAGPFMAILIEATIAEILISIFGINRISYTFTASLLVVYTIVHPFLSQGIIFGTNIYTIYIETFQKLANILKIEHQHIGLIIISYIFIHVLMGALAGWLAFSLSLRVHNEFYHYTPQNGRTG